MTTLDDPGVKALLDKRNHAIVSTVNADGSIHGTVVWVDVEDGCLAVNGAKGRAWPANLERTPTVTVVVYDETNPYDYVEVRGTAREVDGADAHIDRLAKKFIDQDSYPFRQPGEVRQKFLIDATRVRHQKQG